MPLHDMHTARPGHGLRRPGGVRRNRYDNCKLREKSFD